jgi:hypothetical protein
METCSQTGYDLESIRQKKMWEEGRRGEELSNPWSEEETRSSGKN